MIYLQGKISKSKLRDCLKRLKSQLNCQWMVYQLPVMQEKLRASLVSEVTKGNEPFMSLPRKGEGQDEIKSRLRHKVRS